MFVLVLLCPESSIFSVSSAGEISVWPERSFFSIYKLLFSLSQKWPFKHIRPSPAPGYSSLIQEQPQWLQQHNCVCIWMLVVAEHSSSRQRDSPLFLRCFDKQSCHKETGCRTMLLSDFPSAGVGFCFPKWGG